MLVSGLFGVLLIAVVLVFYFRPKRQFCPGCGAPREPEAPLCSACGWIHEDPDDPAEDDTDDPAELEAELIDEPWRGD